MDGKAVMDYLDMPPGPMVGKATAFLLEVKRADGDLEEPELLAKLDAWWAENKDT